MRLFLGLLVSGVLMAPALFAQLNRNLVADIPFDFYLGDKPFAKGTYQIRVTHASGAVLLESMTDVKVSAGSGASLFSSPYGTRREPIMVFAKYDGDHTFLRTAEWGVPDGLNVVLPKSRTEREHVTSRLVTKKTTETLTVLARAR